MFSRFTKKLFSTRTIPTKRDGRSIHPTFTLRELRNICEETPSGSTCVAAMLSNGSGVLRRVFRPVSPVLREPMSDSHKVAKSWVTATCREVFHPNAAHCGPHFSKVFRQVFWQSIKLYTPFFLALNLLNGRKLNTIESWKKLLKSVLRGSLFLSTQYFQRTALEPLATTFPIVCG